ncbi:MAG: HlyD family efflux transporter periplasmic adaptor subunit [Acidobacteriota bacterium]|nr:HlyD family efflux transporter periplasmic adaptor subunit [Acidobacteriota bacterium]
MKKALLGILLLFYAGCGAHNDSDADKAGKGDTAEKAHDADDDGPGVTLRKNAQALAAIRVEKLRAQPLRPELVAYGRLEEDPAESFVVRAAMAGTLRADQWPALGQSLAAGTELGRIEPRLAVTDRIGLNTQLTVARSDLKGSTEAVAAAQKAYDRTRALNADNKNLSDRALQDAEAKLNAEKAREDGLRNTVQVLENALASGTANAAIPVTAARGGQAVALLAQPGESVEQGAPLLRIARFDRLLARIDLPIGQQGEVSKGSARIVPAGFEQQPPIEADPVGVAPSAGTQTQGVSLLYRLSPGRADLRPGIPVTARFTLNGSAGNGVLIPRTAVVQQDGRLWVYVQTSDTRFSRRPVPLDMPTASGYLTAREFAPGDRIVTVGAQSLLSEEFKSQNEADTN